MPARLVLWCSHQFPDVLTDIRNVFDRLQIFCAYLVPRIIGVVEDDVGEVILEYTDKVRKLRQFVP